MKVLGTVLCTFSKCTKLRILRRFVRSRLFFSDPMPMGCLHDLFSFPANKFALKAVTKLPEQGAFRVQILAASSCLPLSLA
jgi:hypothetical protein